MISCDDEIEPFVPFRVSSIKLPVGASFPSPLVLVFSPIRREESCEKERVFSDASAGQS